MPFSSARLSLQTEDAESIQVSQATGELSTQILDMSMLMVEFEKMAHMACWNYLPRW